MHPPEPKRYYDADMQQVEQRIARAPCRLADARGGGRKCAVMSAIALPGTAGAISRKHQAADGAARSATERAVTCGKLLLKAKAALIPSAEQVSGLRQAVATATLVGISPGFDETPVEITGAGGEFLYLPATVGGLTEVIRSRCSIRAGAVDQVLATTGIHPRSSLWRFSPGGPPPIGLRQILLGDARQ
jgi:hypothetical protein